MNRHVKLREEWLDPDFSEARQQMQQLRGETGIAVQSLRIRSPLTTRDSFVRELLGTGAPVSGTLPALGCVWLDDGRIFSRLKANSQDEVFRQFRP